MFKIQGWVEQGNTTLLISGAAGTIARKVQGSFPAATITIFNAGTVTLAPIYADDGAPPTAKANPFISALDGTWFAYVPAGDYDVQFSGGGIAVPFTIGDISAGLGSSGVPSYPFASLPVAKVQDIGNLARVSDSIRGLWMEGVNGWAQVGYGLANVAEFPGVDSAQKGNAARAAIGSAPGVIVFPPSLPAGEPNQVPDNILIMDFRGTAASQGLRFNISSAAGGGLRTKMLMQDNYGAQPPLSPASHAVTFYAYGLVDSPNNTNGTIAAINGSMAVNTATGNFFGALVGIEGEVFVNSTNATPWTVNDARGGTFNSLVGGNQVVNRLASLVAQAPVNQNAPTSVVHAAIGLLVEGFAGIGDVTNYPFWCTGLAVIDGVLAVGAAPIASFGILSRHSTLTGSSQVGVASAPIASSSAIGSGAGVSARCDTAAAVFNQGINACFYAQAPFKGAGSTITLSAGLYIENINVGVSNYAIYSLHNGYSFFTGPLQTSFVVFSAPTPTTGISGGVMAMGFTAVSPVGANGTAAPPTPNPLAYLLINLNGTMVQFPIYNVV